MNPTLTSSDHSKTQKKYCSQKEKSSDYSKSPHKKNAARKRKNTPTSQRLLPQKNVARKRKNRGTILQVSFPTEIRYRDSVDNLDDSDGGDS